MTMTNVREPSFDVYVSQQLGDPERRAGYDGYKDGNVVIDVDLESLRPADRKIAVQHVIDQTRDWLARTVTVDTRPYAPTLRALSRRIHALNEFGRPLRSYVASKGFDQETALDYFETLRRVEYAFCKLIKKGQDEGLINSHGGPLVGVRLEDVIAPEAQGALLHNSDLRKMAGAASDAQFDLAIEAARADGRLSRENIIRLLKGVPSAKITGQNRIDMIAEMANNGATSDDIGAATGNGSVFIRKLAREHGIVIKADEILRNTHRQIDQASLVENTLATMESLSAGIDLFDPDKINNLDRLDDWIARVAASAAMLLRFQRKLTRMSHERRNRS